MNKKIGKGIGPKAADPAMFRKDVEHCRLKLERSLSLYPMATPEEKKRLKAGMDEEISGLDQAIQVYNRSGVQKLEVKIRHEYKKYIADESPENYAALMHDLAELKEFTL